MKNVTPRQASFQEDQNPQIMRARLSQWRIAFASIVGTMLEWYDFTIYNTMAALIFGRLFFPSAQPRVGMILAFSTYAVGYVSRPVGAVVFGWIGDRYGRRTVLVFALTLMGACTASIAVLPTFESIGIVAPLGLSIVRFLQGLALGGEWAGAVLIATEHGSAHRQGRNSSWAQMGPAAGILLATFVIGGVGIFMPDRAFLSWGWRVPFALSAFLMVFGLWVRRAVPETPVFAKSRHEAGAPPLVEVLRKHKAALAIASSSRIGTDVLYSLLLIFSISYITQFLDMPRSVALGCTLTGSACELVAIPVFGSLIDRIGCRKVYAGGILAGSLITLAFFPVFGMKLPLAIFGLTAIGTVSHAAMYAAQGTFITNQFPSTVRYTGSSLAYTLGSLAGGSAFAPLIMSSIVGGWTGTWGITLYVMVTLAVTAAGIVAAGHRTPSEQS
ncbi:major facilitator superfamily MFS_1 [Gluconacetobacter diazotrophicus PA1 5]|uniref:Putative sugar transporter n=3 Tax=Gluconacetobacter diazotrophicus TaxID=33996 RepID=A9H2C4_GLUDA|nr:MFS transporter [Gluconacetobacter diazotrophicus]ACI52016.1 major facilitator superfamily MFS_1 [Gluconacetobacter diazotrophicus PA1 5]TWB05209.1 putative MFS family arabinose efflux permease [Gluconacetobacter diazotrophicus]CAP54135.1 putative sugar transporter [Gluconacetobacter diazotrophicus PA1 5]